MSNTMEPLGSHYAVLLHDPQLRTGLIRARARSGRSVMWLRFAPLLRMRLAATLHQLASRVEPTAVTWSGSSPSLFGTLE